MERGYALGFRNQAFIRVDNVEYIQGKKHGKVCPNIEKNVPLLWRFLGEKYLGDNEFRKFTGILLRNVYTSFIENGKEKPSHHIFWLEKMKHKRKMHAFYHIGSDMGEIEVAVYGSALGHEMVYCRICNTAKLYDVYPCLVYSHGRGTNIKVFDACIPCEECSGFRVVKVRNGDSLNGSSFYVLAGFEENTDFNPSSLVFGELVMGAFS